MIELVVLFDLSLTITVKADAEFYLSYPASDSQLRSANNYMWIRIENHRRPIISVQWKTSSIEGI